MVVNEQATPGQAAWTDLPIEKVQATNKDLNDQAEKLKQQYDAEKAAKTQAVAKLENELRVAKGELSRSRRSRPYWRRWPAKTWRP